MKRACCDFLNSQLDPSNCLGIRDFAETHNCVDLMQAAELFSQKHFSEVVQQEEFMLLSQSEVEKLIKCDEIQVRHSDCIENNHNLLYFFISLCCMINSDPLLLTHHKFTNQATASFKTTPNYFSFLSFKYRHLPHELLTLNGLFGALIDLVKFNWSRNMIMVNKAGDSVTLDKKCRHNSEKLNGM